MLRDLHERTAAGDAPARQGGASGIAVGQADSLVPFGSGLEYSAPARGGWTIVHIGMLLPQSHQVFVCAQSCLRGVVLSAAELNGLHRFSTITVDERAALEGDCEKEIIEGVTHILAGIVAGGSPLPPALLLFTSCIHHFLGTDMKLVFCELERRFPTVGFVQCWMNPTMRKTKTPPDPFMRRQLYALLQPGKREKRQVNLIGSNFAADKSSELYAVLAAGGFVLRDICTCKSFEEYRRLEAGRLNLVTNPLGRPAAAALEERLGQPWLYLPVSYDFEELRRHWQRLADELGIVLDEVRVQERNAAAPLTLVQLRRRAAEALRELAGRLEGFEVALDYTFTARPLGLARLLLESGFEVRRVYLDTISPEEQETLMWLKEKAPQLRLFPTLDCEMAVAPRTLAKERGDGRVLALGQKAAYFTGTCHLVNLVEDGGLYGYGGILRLAELMEEAAKTECDVEALISVKGWGCCC